MIYTIPEYNKKKYDNPIRIRYIKCIGEGSFSETYEVENCDNFNILCAKVYKPAKNSDDDICVKIPFDKEIDLVTKAHHSNIIEYHGHCTVNRIILFELASMDLNTFLTRNDYKLDIRLIVKCMNDTISALWYLHKEMKVLHRDITHTNIMRVNKVWKFIDFNLCKPFTENDELNLSEEYEIVTRWYRSPEILLGIKKYSTAVDIWSLGCIFASFFYGKPLFRGSSKIDQIYKIFQFKGTPNKTSWSGVTKLKYWQDSFPQWKYNENKLSPIEKFMNSIDSDYDSYFAILINGMLEYDPNKRFDVYECMRHIQKLIQKYCL